MPTCSTSYKLTITFVYILLSVGADSSEVIFSSLNKSIASDWQAFEANRWHSFSSWNSNIPPVRQYAAATEILDKKVDGTTREMMLMYGGESFTSDHRTWIFDMEANSWEAVRLESGPKGIIHHTLVSLCKTRVLLFGGVSSLISSGNGMCSNETWMFEMRGKEWKRVNTTIHFLNRNDYVTPRCRHVAAVIRSNGSFCDCKESMVVYSGFNYEHEKWSLKANGNLDDLWLLTCKDVVSLVYVWKRLEQSPPKLTYPSLISAFENKIVYFYGVNFTKPFGTPNANELWSYCVSTATWKKHSHSVEYKMRSTRTLYFSNYKISNHFLVLWSPRDFHPPFVFDLVNESWSSNLDVKFELPNLADKNIIITKVGDKIVVYGKQYVRLGTPSQIWFLTLSDGFQLNVLKMPFLKLSPVKPIAISTHGFMHKQQEMLLYGGVIVRGNNPAAHPDNLLYRLDLKTLQWSAERLGSSGTTKIRFLEFSTGTVLSDCILVVFGGIPQFGDLKQTEAIYDIVPSDDIWGYYNQDSMRLWIKYLPRGFKPAGRMVHAATAIDSQTMAIYGGITFHVFGLKIVELLHDLWIFTLPPLNEKLLGLSQQQNEAEWKMIDRLGANTSYAMSLVSIDNVLYVYGGSQTVFTIAEVFYANLENIEISCRCLDTLWTYNLSNNIGWEKMHYKGKSPGNRCFHQSHAFGNKILLTGGCSNYFALRINRYTLMNEINCEEERAGVWIYDPNTISWLRLSSQPLYHINVFGSFIVVWNDLLLSFGGFPVIQSATGQVPGDWNGFYIFKPACPAGTTSKDVKVEMCYNCPVGQLSATSNSRCLACPDGLTTEHEGSSSPANCSRCEANYCGYGTCYVTLPGPSPICECQFGFTKNNKGFCTVATYYIAASGFLAGVALFILIVVLLTKFRKARKDHKVILKNKDHELTELLTSIFNIDSRELKLRKRIDKDCPGGYGEVYQAEYREIIVAVKKLQGIHLDLDRIELEFEREIEVMRAIRHPNIVLFLGGGRYHDDGCPFLVVEYMSRGSLTNILKNKGITLEDNLKLRFTVDAAKGMRFLHNLRPPRVHRDLKSSNLLVSQQWLVKVADFGSARLVKDEGISQEAVRGAGPLDLTAPLLGADYQLSSGVGTPSWCAPEILSGQGYGTPADVYR